MRDNFIFNQTTPCNIGAVTVAGFNPTKEMPERNAVITMESDPNDFITLVGVHSSALHASDFHFLHAATAATTDLHQQQLEAHASAAQGNVLV